MCEHLLWHNSSLRASSPSLRKKPLLEHNLHFWLVPQEVAQDFFHRTQPIRISSSVTQDVVGVLVVKKDYFTVVGLVS